MAFEEIMKELESNVSLTFLPVNVKNNFELTKKQDWVKELLMELNEKAYEKSPEEYLNETELNITMCITRKNQTALGDYVIVEGKLQTLYATECVKTGMPMKEPLSLEFKACALEKTFETSPEYQDQTEIFIDNKIYELFFYEKRKLNIKDIVHEFIFLNLNQYPSLEAVSDGTLTTTNNTRQ
jgi:hypothetical protein